MVSYNKCCDPLCQVRWGTPHLRLKGSYLKIFKYSCNFLVSSGSSYIQAIPEVVSYHISFVSL